MTEQRVVDQATQTNTKTRTVPTDARTSRADSLFNIAGIKTTQTSDETGLQTIGQQSIQSEKQTQIQPEQTIVAPKPELVADLNNLLQNPDQITSLDDFNQLLRNIMGGSDVTKLTESDPQTYEALQNIVVNNPSIAAEIEATDPALYDQIAQTYDRTAVYTEYLKLEPTTKEAFDLVCREMRGNPMYSPAVFDAMQQYTESGGDFELIRAHFRNQETEQAKLVVGTLEQPLAMVQFIQQLPEEQQLGNGTDLVTISSQDGESVEVTTPDGQRAHIPLGYIVLAASFDILFFKGYYTQELLSQVFKQKFEQGLKNKFEKWGFDTNNWGTTENRTGKSVIEAMDKRSILDIIKNSRDNKQLLEFLEFVPKRDRQKMLSGEDFGGGMFGGKRLNDQELKIVFDKISELKIDEAELSRLEIRDIYQRKQSTQNPQV